MATIDNEGKVREISIEAVITRADGTVEDLGVISVTRFEDDDAESLRDRVTKIINDKLGRA
jgi:hypothetical protein